MIGDATPAIDPSTLPDPNGATYARKALTGDIGLVANPDGAISPFVRFGRSYRHPNLEEMLFAGPATTGSIVPNVTVEPETGNNFDAGVKFRVGSVSRRRAISSSTSTRTSSRRTWWWPPTPSGPLAQVAQLRRRAHHRRRAVGRDADRVAAAVC